MPRRIITGKDVEESKIKLAEKGDITTQPPVSDDYTEKIVKLIPGEAVTIFLAIDNIMKSHSDFAKTYYWLFFIFSIILTLFLAYYVSEGPAPLGRSKGQAFTATIAFILWVFAIGGPFTYLGWIQESFSGIFLMVFTAIAPKLPEAFKDLQDSRSKSRGQT